MKWKRMILLGMLLWIILFFEVLFLVFAMGVSVQLANIIHYLFAAVLTVFAGVFYFRKGASFPEGLAVGFVFAVTGLALDMVISVPIFVKSYGSYFVDASNWIVMCEIILISGIVGFLKK